MTDSTHLALPFLDQAQAQKHVTHNEALRVLDGLVQASVLDRDLAAPPGSPAAGARYLVAAGASGAWAGHSGEIAHYEDGAWRFHVPRAGWRLHIADEGVMLVHTGAAWIPLGHALGAVETIASLGLGTTSDASNAFAAKLRNALFAAKTPAEGGDGDIQIKLVKTALADIASLLFQTNFSGRAEAGLIGDDAFRIKVSNNGSTWFDGLSFDPASGKAAFPNGAEAPAGLLRTDVQTFTSSGTWTKPAFAKFVRVFAIGGGGGGGAGRRSAAGTAAGGGAGGNPGGFVDFLFAASDLGATETVTIGAGGAGAAAAANSSNGGAGVTGGATTVGSNKVNAVGGTGGLGGSNSAGGQPVASSQSNYPPAIVRGGAGGFNAVGGTPTINGLGSSYSMAAAGGGGGGGLASAGGEFAGGAGQGSCWGLGLGLFGAAGTTPGGAGGAGGASGNPALPGGGGGGGGSANAAAAGAGGAGSLGAGGGGGGGGRDGQTGGGGGAGGAGKLVAISFG